MIQIRLNKFVGTATALGLRHLSDSHVRVPKRNETVEKTRSDGRAFLVCDALIRGQQTRNESLFYYFRLEEQISE